MIHGLSEGCLIGERTKVNKMSIMRILKILFYSAILLIPPWLFFGEGMKQVYEATEYVCMYSLYVALILGYIVHFIEGCKKATPKMTRLSWVLYYHMVKIPIFLTMQKKLIHF